MQAKVSGREREILVLASKGLTDKAIAAQLNLSVRTVGTYWERLRVKTSGASRAHILMETLGKELESAALEAREARMERDLLLEQSEGFAVFSIGIDRKILEWNSGVFRVLGFERDDFIGQDVSIVYTEEDTKLGVPEVELEGARQHGKFIETRYHLRKDGRHIWVDGTMVAIYDGDKQVRKYAKIMRDDSKMKALQDQVSLLQSSNAQELPFREEA